jgi:hypothetical protein
MIVFFCTSDPGCAMKRCMDRHNSSAQPQDRDVVRGVEVRPVSAAEQPFWDEPMPSLTIRQRTKATDE